MKKYLDLDGLAHFLNWLIGKFVSNDDIVTDAEIDEICGTIIYTADEVEL